MNSASERRVVITGIGIICPMGSEPDEVWAAFSAGESAVRAVESIPRDVLVVSHGAEARQFTGAIGDYGPLEKPLQRAIRKGQKLMCREIEMGVAAAQRALIDAGLSSEQRDPLRTGVLYGSDYIMTLPQEFSEGIQSCRNGEGRFDFAKWAERGLPKVNPLWLLKYLPNMPASHVAIYNDLRGPNNSLTLREASPAAAIGEAWSTISRGHADALLVGATGTRIHPYRTLHVSMQEPLAQASDDPSEMSRPFDKHRSGAVLGEGAACLVLESHAHASARGAQILGEIQGFGSRTVSPQRYDDYQCRAVEGCLRATLRDRDPSSIGHISSHGASTREGDYQEAIGIGRVFGPPAKSPPVVAPKGNFGNLGAGGGMAEIVLSLLALQRGQLFPAVNYDPAGSDCEINLCTDSSTPAGDNFISLNFTPQGQATAVHISSFA